MTATSLRRVIDGAAVIGVIVIVAVLAPAVLDSLIGARLAELRLAYH